MPALDAVGLAVHASVLILAAILAYRRPAYAVALLIVVIPFDWSREIARTTVTTEKVALCGSIAGLVVRRVPLEPLRAPAARAFLFAGFAVFAATALSVSQAEYPGPALRETLKALEYLAVFAVVVVAVRADTDPRPVRVAIAAAVGIVSVLALLQEATGAPSAMLFSGHAIPRIAGPIEGPNQLASYLGIGLALVASTLLAERRNFAFEGVALVAGMAAVVLTISRTGVVSVVLGLALVVAVSRANRRRHALLLAGGGAVIGITVLAAWGGLATHSLAGLELLGRFFAFDEAPQPGSVGDRSQLWEAALVLWHRHPLLGIGAGNFELELGQAGFPGLRTHANSLYLQALAEGGIVLFAAVAALVVLSIGRFARGPFGEPFVVGAFGASAGLAVHHVFDLLVFYPKVGAFWWIALALGAARLDVFAARDADAAREPPAERT